MVLGAVPVQEQHGGVVADRPAADVQDCCGEGLGGRAGVEVVELAEQQLDLGFGGFMFVHPVGDEHQSIVGSQLQVLYPIGGVGEHAEDQIDVQVDRVDLSVPDEQWVHVAGVDDLGGAGAQGDPEQLGGDELVRGGVGGVGGQGKVGLLGLLDQAGTAPAAVAQ